MTTLHCRMSVVEVLLSLPARRYDSAGNRRSYGPVSVCLCRPMSSGVLLKIKVGIRKGAWRRSRRYPVYLWSLRWVYAVKKTRRLVYGVYPRIPPPQYTTAYVDVSVYYKSVFYSKRVPVDGLIWFWQGGFFQPVLHWVIRKFMYLPKQVYFPLGHFPKLRSLKMSPRQIDGRNVLST